MKTERLLEIIFILLEKKVVTAKELADRFQVSQRTIYRDLIALSASGIPVYTEQGRNGGIHLIEEYALNKTLLTDTEQSQIVMALQSMRAIGQDDMSTSLSKVKGIFQRDFDDWIEIDFSGWSYSNIEQQMFQIIKESILHAQVLEFEYSSLKGETITREVEPYKLVFKGRNWYLSAFCLHKKEFRFFKLIRMRNPRIKQEKVDRTHFVIYENKKTEEYSPKMIKTRLKIDRKIFYRILDDFRDDIVEETEDAFIVEKEIEDNRELMLYLLSFADGLTILEPEWLRADYTALLRNMLNRY